MLHSFGPRVRRRHHLSIRLNISIFPHQRAFIALRSHSMLFYWDVAKIDFSILMNFPFFGKYFTCSITVSNWRMKLTSHVLFGFLKIALIFLIRLLCFQNNILFFFSVALANINSQLNFRLCYAYTNTLTRRTKWKGKKIEKKKNLLCICNSLYIVIARLFTREKCTEKENRIKMKMTIYNNNRPWQMWTYEIQRKK